MKKGYVLNYESDNIGMIYTRLLQKCRTMLNVWKYRKRGILPKASDVSGIGLIEDYKK